MKFLWKSLVAFYASSIGKKLIVAITGIALLLFLAGHMTGNLLIYFGPDAINEYGVWLRELGHGSMIWIARFGLLVCFVGHVLTTILLVRQNRAARGEIRYQHEATIQASNASRTMIISGIIILAFLIYHLMHFTFGVANEYYTAGGPYELANGHHNVYKMVVDGFSWVPASIFYIVSMALLCFHLSHGFASVFQTLGLRTDRSWPLITAVGKLYAAAIFIGNVSIPLSILTGIVS